jgi:DNA-binding transcriptional regulator PaaX
MKLKTIGQGILYYLGEYQRSYGNARSAMHGYEFKSFSSIQIVSKLPYSESSVRVTLRRLEEQGLVEKQDGLWKITGLGKSNLKKTFDYSKYLKELHLSAKRKKNMIVSFDIPEKMRARRNWLRGELLAMGFICLQKSLWFGPSPLPKNFVKEIGYRDLLKHLKFFKAEPQNII